MAATGNEVVLVSQAKIMYDKLAEAIAGGALPPGGVTSGDIADGAVTSSKIAADAVTGDKIATGAVTSDSIADGTITAGDIAAGVIPDVSEFITETEANAAYQPKGDYLTTVPKATDSALGGVMIGYVKDRKNYPLELDEYGKGFVNVPWTDTNTTYEVATTSADGLMSSEDKTKLDGLNNYILPAASTTAIGGVKITSNEDFKSFLGI